MTMHWIDWAILGGLVSFVCIIAFITQKYTQSVADYLAGNRCAGKYLLGVADGIAGLGAVSIVARFELHYKAGFTGSWWDTMLLPIGLIVAITGWVQYRFRQTRAMTMAQFFELRYSRRFRIFAGITGFISGIFNFAVFPAVGGHFFQYYCGFPSIMVHLGPVEFDIVYAAIMFVLLFISASFTLMGGQIAVMVTDFFQGIFCNAFFMIVALYLLWHFNWSVIGEGVAMAPKDQSLINPMHTSGTDNFNITYFLIQAFGNVLCFMAWQGNQGYFGAAKSPHEARMGRMIGSLRIIPQNLPLVLIPVCAYVFLHHPSFAQSAAGAHSVLQRIADKNPQLASQLTVSVAMTHFLPIGILGGFAAVMFAAFVSTHDTYMHAWGSIFIQDVILPLRQILKGEETRLAPETHLRWLRYSVVGVTLFIFIFALFMVQRLDILMYFALTGTIYLGWAGTTIVGGLYWKYGNTRGAWAAGLIGLTFALFQWHFTYYYATWRSGLETWFPHIYHTLAAHWPGITGGETGNKCPVSPQILWFFTMIISGWCYILFSTGLKGLPHAIGGIVSGVILKKLLSFFFTISPDWTFFWYVFLSTVSYILLIAFLYRGEEGINMDKLLHQGKYARKDDPVVDPPRGLKIFTFSKEFRWDDKVIFVITYGYLLIFSSIFLVGTLVGLHGDLDDTFWLRFWRYYSMAMIGLGSFLTLWLTVGGLIDLKDLFYRLRTIKRDIRDDGSVIAHQNLDEVNGTETSE